MPEHLNFGGGAGASFITPAVLIIAVIAALMLASLPRKYAPAPIVVIAFLIPYGQQVFIAGVHFYVLRILVVVGLCRLLVVKFSSRRPLFPNGFSRIDRAYCLFVLVGGVAFILRERVSGAIVYQLALWLDAFGLYFVLRHLLQTSDDIYRLFKMLVVVVVVLGSSMLYEYFTRNDLFSYLAGYQIVPWIRNGRVRAQAGFANSITAGSFGATLVPLFISLWRRGKAKQWAGIGLIFAIIVAITSMASTPITGLLAGILALCMWPLRRRMQWVRRGIVFLVLGLALVMHAPVWFLLARVNVAGGNAYDRAILVDQTVHHFSEWWLVGTDNNAKWGFFTWDACNQFVAEGVSGGLAALALFIVVLSRSFGTIGRCRKYVRDHREQWFFWSLGAALFAHVIVFLGLDYFDQTHALWVMFLAMISSATLGAVSIAGKPSEPIEGRIVAPRIGSVRSIASVGARGAVGWSFTPASDLSDRP